MCKGAGVYICECAYVPRRMYADVRICIRTDVPVIYTGKPAPVSHELFRLRIAHISSIAGAARTCRNSEVSSRVRRAPRASGEYTAAPLGSIPLEASEAASSSVHTSQFFSTSNFLPGPLVKSSIHDLSSTYVKVPDSSSAAVAWFDDRSRGRCGL